MLPLLVSINVNDEKKIVLTQITAKNAKTVKKESDHNSIITILVMQWNIDIIIEKQIENLISRTHRALQSLRQ